MARTALFIPLPFDIMKTTHPITTMLRYAAGSAGVLTLVWGAAHYSVGSPPEFPAIMLAGTLLLVLGLLYYFVNLWLDLEKGYAPTPDDPWSMQESLMKASGQFLPMSPVLTNESLLYLALIAEEFGETAVGMGRVLEGFDGDHISPELRDDVRTIGPFLKTWSSNLRTLLKSERFLVKLTQEQAVEILDGTTDIAVVNCGLALSCGLPGQSGYVEVASSNLSKINPNSGVIEKTGDGKWIKGPMYIEPDLAKVLQNCA